MCNYYSTQSFFTKQSLNATADKTKHAPYKRKYELNQHVEYPTYQFKYPT